MTQTNEPSLVISDSEQGKIGGATTGSPTVIPPIVDVGNPSPPGTGIEFSVPLGGGD